MEVCASQGPQQARETTSLVTPRRQLHPVAMYIMIRSRVNLWCRDRDPGSFRVAGIVLVVAREIPAAIDL